MQKTIFFLLFLFGLTMNGFSQGNPSTNWSDNTDTQWYSAQSTDLTINSAEELAGLAELTANGNDFSGVTITLTSDIDLSAHLWSPIGVDDAQPFSGTFDGAGFTISNVIIDMPTSSMIGCDLGVELSAL
ncbi:hypothetical protein CW751_13740 [Brumimicrobium salinarum]|uniref:Lipid/polyisoprenoid-binding YceI-like domain-containing protein n=1 Tax=Brumimicrobium salinarum TaxID=2058658 RepID=A0A2I0QZE1_9FLAO|nr:hypothetical protein [Brumimicrobium salinarum]PKR79696.1 hypothetical protein CW751_13740 [Brumimicrobium salinarum]